MKVIHLFAAKRPDAHDIDYFYLPSEKMALSKHRSLGLIYSLVTDSQSINYLEYVAGHPNPGEISDDYHVWYKEGEFNYNDEAVRDMINKIGALEQLQNTVHSVFDDLYKESRKSKRGE